MEEKDLIELALAYWRLLLWVGKAEVEKKRAAYSSLRKIEAILSSQGVQLLTYDGQVYDIGLPVSVADNTEDLDCDGKVIQKTVEPVIIRDSKVLHYGSVLLERGNNK